MNDLSPPKLIAVAGATGKVGSVIVEGLAGEESPSVH